MRLSATGIAAVLVAFAAHSNAATVHHYRFESDLGFLVDAAGNGDLINAGPAPQPYRLPATGRGAGFSKGFDLGQPTPNVTGVALSSGALTSTIGALPNGFTIETYVRFDSISAGFGKILAADSQGSQNTPWTFQVRTDGFGGTSLRELIVVIRPGTTSLVIQSDFIVETDTDYYLAASFDPAGEAVFYVQNLSAGDPLQVIPRAHAISSPPSTGQFAVGNVPGISTFGVDGIMDEVRLSDVVLDQDELLISNVDSDVDGDGVDNRSDNCVFVVNADQRDSDQDGFGNSCDGDLNGDCATNAIDLGLMRTVFFSADGDADFSGDGVVNAIDLGILKNLFFAPPGSSGIPNSCDD